MEIPIVEGNASELREVFIDILFNAVDAMPKGGELTIQAKSGGKSVFVTFFWIQVKACQKKPRKGYLILFYNKGIERYRSGDECCIRNNQ